MSGFLFPDAAAWAGNDRFSVLGWVKSRFSSQTDTRSEAPRSSGPAMAAPQMGAITAREASFQNTPGSAPSRPPATPAAMMTPPDMAPPALPPAPRSSLGSQGGSTVAELRRRAEFLATRGLTYKFGGDHPSEGGMDCSGTMQFTLKSMGIPDIPRTSYAQYEWLEDRGTLRKVGFWRSSERAIRDFRPGDLIFWGGTYNSGHRVSHVMVYLGRNKKGTHYVFGARGKKVKGLNGNGVDIFEFKPESTGGRLVGYGRPPGLKDR